MIGRRKPILQSIDNITAFEGDDITVTCKALHDVNDVNDVNDGQLRFQFGVLENGTWILDPGLSSEDYVWKSDNVRWHGVNLRLVNVTPKDEGNYYCMVGDYRGLDHFTFYIKVLPRPTCTPEAQRVSMCNNTRLSDVVARVQAHQGKNSGPARKTAGILYILSRSHTNAAF